MGGLGSGRKPAHFTIDDCLCLEVADLLKQSEIPAGGRLSGVVKWMCGSKETAAVGFVLRLAEKDGQIRLYWACARDWSREYHRHENQIAITSMPQPLGGRRMWFVCPLTGKLASKLYLPPGGTIFACRRAHGLIYASQRESPPYRALRRAFALRERLKSDGDIGDYVMKPKGMHWRTFVRAMARLAEKEAEVEAHTATLQRRLQDAEQQCASNV